jgi:hypothetical protein
VERTDAACFASRLFVEVVVWQTLAYGLQGLLLMAVIFVLTCIQCLCILVSITGNAIQEEFLLLLTADTLQLQQETVLCLTL